MNSVDHFNSDTHSLSLPKEGHISDAEYIDLSPTHSEPVAVVGIGCRLPGDVSSDTQLWEYLVRGHSGQCDVPKARFNIDAFYNPNPERPGSIPMKGGYFLKEDVRSFENSFFGINNLEAAHMDPQQRKLLEVCFESLESAGVSLSQAAGANTGCYVGNFTVDFQNMLGKDSEYLHRFTATGMGTTLLSNRISYVFDLKGPSLTLDTACSSSLYCLHLACKAIQQRECDSAIVAGANLIQSPEQHMGTARLGVLSKTSTCHSFGSEADGYGRAEGIGALYVKRLTDALHDGDPIRSIIRGTAVNSNGKTPGITMPSAVGQHAVIAKAYADAGLDPKDTDYVECHGTGTPVGDPIEVEALANFFTKLKSSPRDQKKLLIGSVKSNMGHSEAASGITGIIKATLALERLSIPPTISIKAVNPDIPWDQYGINVTQSLTSWPRRNDQSHIPRASVNSFGYGGSNAHCILDRGHVHPHAETLYYTDKTARDRKFIIPLSAATRYSLEKRVELLAAYDLESVKVDDLAYTLGERRSHLPERGFIIANQDHLPSSVNLSAIQPTYRRASRLDSVPYAFMFTGQGAQWPQMGKSLFENIPTFRNTILRLDRYLAELPEPPSWSLEENIVGSSKSHDIHLPSHSQPLCTAMQVALVDLLREWSIVPRYVVGHSSGEIAAAYAAGHISSFFAIAIAYYRGLVVSHNTQDGAMLAVGMSADETSKILEALKVANLICIACINSPENVTVSGDAAAIDLLLQYLQSRGKLVRKLKTGGQAYHSHHMKLFGEAYHQKIHMIKTAHPTCISPKDSASKNNNSSCVMISTVFAAIIESKQPSDPSYWRLNLETSVRFKDCIEILTKSERCQMIEIGPHSTLELPVKQTLSHVAESGDHLPYFSVMVRSKDSLLCALNLMGNLWTCGHPISFEKVNHKHRVDSGALRTPLYDLPTYPWDYSEPLWMEPRASYEFRQRKYPHDELLGSQTLASSGLTWTWRNLLKASQVPWLKDHRLNDVIVFPAAAYISMGAKALQQVSEVKPVDRILEVRDIQISTALVLPEDDAVELFTELVPQRISGLEASKNWWRFAITTRAENKSVQHAGGLVGFVQPPSTQSKPHSDAQNFERQSPMAWYSRFTEVGLVFGPKFQSLAEIYNPRTRDMMTTQARMANLPDIIDPYQGQYTFDVHPIVTDAQLQVSIIATTSGSIVDLEALVPVSISQIQLYPHLQHDRISSYISQASAKNVAFGVALSNVELVNELSQPLLRLHGIRGSRFMGSTVKNPQRYPMLRVEWLPDVSKLQRRHTKSLAAFVQNKSRTSTHGQETVDPCVLHLLQLVSSQSCDTHVLELGEMKEGVTKDLLAVLEADNKFRRFSSYTRALFDDEGRPFGHEINGTAKFRAQTGGVHMGPIVQEFNTVICYNIGQAKLEPSLKLLHPEGVLLWHGEALDSLPETADVKFSERISLGETPATYLIKKNITKHSNLLVNGDSGPHGINLITANSIGALDLLIADRLTAHYGTTTRILTLDDVGSAALKKGCMVVVTVELNSLVLCHASMTQLQAIQKITSTASQLLWITCGQLLRSSRPELAAVLGLSRAVMLEQPTLNFLVLDIDDTAASETTVENLLTILRTPPGFASDHEYIQKDGILYISRFLPDRALNHSFQTRKTADARTAFIGDASHSRLHLREPGQLDTLEFTEIDVPQSISAGHVEVQVKSFGLNAKDIYTLAGKVDTHDKTCSLEFAGLVTRVGSSVSNFAPGDRVVVAAPNHFAVTQSVPEFACCRMRSDETFTELATVPIAYMTALHALTDRGRLQRNETVLIHSAAGGVGIAAIQVAQDIGATVYATVGTEEKRSFLIEKLGIDPSHIFNSRGLSFVSEIMESTGGRGIDLILNSLTGEQLHASLDVCAHFGRFIEIGKRDILDGGALSLQAFSKGLTFSAFDLSEYYYSDLQEKRMIWHRLLKQGVDCYRKMPKFPLHVFDVGRIREAFKLFANSNRIGKIAVSLEKPTSQIRLVPQRYQYRFNPEKTYLLVGCLGGLGRCLARYMLLNGARHFSFIGRSATDKTAAAELVQDLRHNGAEVDVIRGDVQDSTSVDEALNRMRMPLGGVVQAAMGLGEALFESMTHSKWHMSLGPKIQGTWNIHKAIQGRETELEFFLITSSLAGSVGAATESNYCTANSFLDYFARYRRSQGLRATSIGFGTISEIGYLHEHPEIDEILRRRGLTATNEADLLQICDIALCEQAASKASAVDVEQAHILSGLEASAKESAWSRGFEGGAQSEMADPRMSILRHAESTLITADSTASARDGIPTEITNAVAAKDVAALQEALYKFLAQKVSQLVLVPAEALSPELNLATLGMDSMLAAEYRTFIFHVLKVDVPFLMLLDRNLTMQGLAGHLRQGLLH